MKRILLLGALMLLATLLPLALIAGGPMPRLTVDQYNNVTLAWDRNPETDIAGYKVYTSPVTGGPYTLVGTVTGAPASPQFTVSGAPAGNNCYVVTAFNTSSLESGYSNEVCTLIIYPPQPPKGLHIITQIAVVIDKKHAVVNWTTDLLADSRVDYGAAPNAFNFSTAHKAYVLAHSEPLNLLPNRWYYYKVTSKTADGLIATATGSFYSR